MRSDEAAYEWLARWLMARAPPSFETEDEEYSEEESLSLLTAKAGSKKVTSTEVRAEVTAKN